MLDPAKPPGQQGFRMPAEWAPHASTWLAWPHKEASWPGRLERIPPVFAKMAALLAPGEHVDINIADAAMKAAARDAIAAIGAASALDAISFHRFPTDDAWIRDHGPIFINRPGGGQAILDWEYNAWGGKYPPYDLDNQIPARIAQLLGLPRFQPGMVLEGGSIDVDGEGTLLTTEACLLNPNRNPSLSRAEIESQLRAYLGIERILWLGDGIAGDDTDGHVDDCARFAAPGVAVAAVEPDASDANYAPLAANFARLRGFRDARGRRLELFTLPMPPPLEFDGQRVPASYANFYIANRVVLMPAFQCARDERAARVLEVLFPGRAIAPVEARDLVWGLGACHCLTQQQPAPEKA
jgi:agmatine deiminase